MSGIRIITLMPLSFPLRVYQFVQYHLFRRVAYVVHSPYPRHLILRFELLRDALLRRHLTSQAGTVKSYAQI